jgi:hypothetical protein
MIKGDSSPLTTSVITIRDSINTALNVILIQQMECNPVKYLTLTTMNTVKITSLNSKIPQSLHLIPRVTRVHLVSLHVYLLVYRMPTSYTLVDIGMEPTYFNTGLSLIQ